MQALLVALCLLPSVAPASPYRIVEEELGLVDSPDVLYSPDLSPDGLHLVQRVEVGARKRVLIDGQVIGEYEWVTPVQFSADSAHYALGVKGGETCVLIRDGRREVVPYEDIWHVQLSADARHLAYRAAGNGRAAVVLDGRVGASFAEIEGICFGADGEHLAYSAKDESGRWHMVIDGEATGDYERIKWFLWSPAGSRLFCVAQEGDRKRIVVDGADAPLYYAVHNPNFGPGGKRFAYLAVTDPGRKENDRLVGRKYRVIIDGEASPEYDHIWLDSGPGMFANSLVPPVVFSPNGERVAYVAARGDRHFAVIDGVPGPEFAWVSRVEFSADSHHYLYVGCSARGRGYDRDLGPGVVVIDGKPGTPYDGFPQWGNTISGYGLPEFSADGRHAAWAARRGEDCFAVIDGVESPPYARVAPPVPSPDWSRYGYVARRHDGTPVIVIDGRETEARVGYQEPVFSPDSRHVAYSVQAAGPAEDMQAVVIDDEPGPLFQRAGNVFFSPDSKHVGYWAAYGQLLADPKCMVVDHQPGPAVDRIISHGDGPRFDDQNRLRYLAARGSTLLRISHIPVEQ